MWASIKAPFSWIKPVSSPSVSRWITPCEGAGESLVIPASASALLFATPICAELWDSQTG
ncbi:hypothetical protein D3C72_1853500 [compost metagenome]